MLAVWTLLRPFAPALAMGGLVLALLAWQRHEGAESVRRKAVTEAARRATETARAQVGVTETDRQITADAGQRTIVIYRETADAVEDIRSAPMGSGSVVRADDLRGLRDRVERLRHENAAGRDAFLERGAEAEPVRSRRPPHG